MEITKPGVYPNISHAGYIADPVPVGSLSSSGARTILSSPARFAYDRVHPRVAGSLDIGTITHGLVLGSGPDVVIVEADSWRTNAAKEAAAEARDEGKVPILAKDYEPARLMAESVMSHPTARALIEQEGLHEASEFAIDPETGEWLRSRPDVLPDASGRRPIIVDLKTALSADPEKFARHAGDFGYHQQHAFYVDLDALIFGDRDAAFALVVVEKAPPYLVSVVELDEEAVDCGRGRNRAAIDRWHQCRQAGQWPGYGNAVHRVSLPPYILNKKISP